jgi:alpha-glucosidase (family GH31 glycosyl hydrolase)
MTKLNKNLQCDTVSKALEENLIIGKGFRITLITPRLLRVEVQRDDEFCDEATLSFWNREQGKVKYDLENKGRKLLIKTDSVVFSFCKILKKIDRVMINNKWVACNNKGNLRGTARTLDMTVGSTKLGLGIISISGVAVIDDSKNLLLVDSEIKNRTINESDKYIFAYGDDFRGAMKDFYKITGEVPLLPRYALGNWWSRYRAYTQNEYIKLMERFEKENLPFTVATVDMDWHWVKVNEKFGTNYKSKNPFQSEGWTGYSWNTDLFPNYREFLEWLHKHNYHTTLNLHPASGVRHYEDMYDKMASNMGVDAESKEDINFDIADTKFINNYFDVIHHPYEKEGVDFWWMDWQQGKKSSLDGLDPLWALNHYHFLDNSKDSNRGILLSRYSGVGSHRYPLGFSGDTITRWASLKFQPYFTANAANIGYGWWSHDIGGHALGVHDDELYLRWCQYGIFSPINRLHSTSHDLMGKEPWNYSDVIRNIVNDNLRLRHRMIPYIYSMNYRSYSQGISLCEPMYYSYPNSLEAYIIKNQYMFGSELMVAPIVSKNCKEINKGKVTVWLPEGRYTDIFTGRIYNGSNYVTMFRDWTSIPVLAKAGAIIPLGNNINNDYSNPTDMDLLIYRGNNSFTLYEDDGISSLYKDGKCAFTTFSISEEDDKISFNIDKVEGDIKSTVKNRTYHLKFKDIINAKLKLNINGVESNSEFSSDIEIKLKPSDKAEIILTDYEVMQNPDPIESAKVILSRYQKNTIIKSIMYRGISQITDVDEFEKAIRESLFPEIVKIAVLEVMDKTIN